MSKLDTFRQPDGKLDRVYLRVCAIWRLLKSGRIGWAEAERYAARPVKGQGPRGQGVASTVAIWKGSRLARESLGMAEPEA